MPFATYEDVARRLGRELSGPEQESATEALAEAEAAVVAYTGQRFNAGTYTDYISTANGRATLSQWPVTSVTAYRIDGETSTVSDLTVRGNVVSGLPVGVPVEIDYSAGYTEVPVAVKGVVVRAAIGLMMNPSGVAGSVAIGGVTQPLRSGMLSPDDLAILDGYRDVGGVIFLR